MGHAAELKRDQLYTYEMFGERTLRPVTPEKIKMIREKQEQMRDKKIVRVPNSWNGRLRFTDARKVQPKAIVDHVSSHQLDSDTDYTDSASNSKKKKSKKVSAKKTRAKKGTKKEPAKKLAAGRKKTTTKSTGESSSDSEEPVKKPATRAASKKKKNKGESSDSEEPVKRPAARAAGKKKKDAEERSNEDKFNEIFAILKDLAAKISNRR